jgi:hypothetical protein
MKANEAPEKLYLLSNGLISYCRNTDEDIEYTRTDAFIDKAVRRLENYLDNGMWIANDVGYREKEAIIEDFRKYMEGE